MESGGQIRSARQQRLAFTTARRQWGFFFNSTARPTHKSTKTQLAAHQSSQATTLFFNRSAKAETSQRKGRVAAANGKKFSIPKAN
jgi:hypothetical protein